MFPLLLQHILRVLTLSPLLNLPFFFGHDFFFISPLCYNTSRRCALFLFPLCCSASQGCALFCFLSIVGHPRGELFFCVSSLLQRILGVRLLFVSFLLQHIPRMHTSSLLPNLPFSLVIIIYLFYYNASQGGVISLSPLCCNASGGALSFSLLPNLFSLHGHHALPLSLLYCIASQGCTYSLPFVKMCFLFPLY